MELTEILPGIYAVGTALWIEPAETLVFGDVHIGYEEALSKKGYFGPSVQFKETVKSIESILKVVRPKTIVINGDLKHEFGQISDQEWMETSKFVDILSEHCEKIILIKGNHDTVLGPIAKKKKLELVEFLSIGIKPVAAKTKGLKKIISSLKKPVEKILITHGDKIREEAVAQEADLIVIGNEHVAVTLHDGAKAEKYKAFLLGKWKRQKLIAMPSFLPTIEGTDIKREGRLLSPYLHQDLDNFDAFIVGDKVYKFGKIKYI